MRRGCALAAAFCVFAVALRVDGTRAQPVEADVATLLFEQTMWRDAPGGSSLRYGFARRAGRMPLGASFDDDIVVKLEPGADPESRTCEIQMFSGRRARTAGPFYSSRTNPILLLVLEQNVQEIGRVTGIAPSHLRDAIRKAWRDEAAIVGTPVNVAGGRVAGTRITVAPFGGDPARDKMKGLQALTYAVEIADSVPGRIVRIDIRTPAGSATAFSETLRYLGNKRR